MGEGFSESQPVECDSDDDPGRDLLGSEDLVSSPELDWGYTADSPIRSAPQTYNSESQPLDLDYNSESQPLDLSYSPRR